MDMELKEAHGAGIGAAIDAGRKIGTLESGVTVMPVQGIPHLIIPGKEPKSLEHLLERPNALTRKATFTDPDSFINYVNEFKDDHTRIYSTMGCGKMVCVLDDHQSNIYVDPDNEGFDPSVKYSKPRWGRHVATFAPELTDEWEQWSKLESQQMGQLDFAEFIESRELDIIDPNSAKLMETISHIQIGASGGATSSVSTVAGGLAYSYQTSKGINGATSIPALLTIRAEVWHGSGLADMRIRLRYRISRGEDHSVQFFYVIADRERIMLAAWNALFAKIADGTQCKAFHGTIG